MAVTIETQHEDMIHDSQFDYYGSKLATASSDKTIRIFAITNGQQTAAPLAILTGHEGPVWQVSWAHPKWGTVIASCSYDRKVIVWKELNPSTWQPVFTHSEHVGSVNSIAFCPHEYGLELACASSDGTVSLLAHRPDDTWDVKTIETKQVGVNAVSWEPCASGEDATVPKRIVTAGCDNTVKIWSFDAAAQSWSETCALKEHSDWVRDVAWAPNMCMPSAMIASCSQDKLVKIWVENEPGSNNWTCKMTLPAFNAPVWRVSWSLTGNILAVSCGDNSVTLWKEAVAGDFEKLSDITESDVQQTVQ